MQITSLRRGVDPCPENAQWDYAWVGADGRAAIAVLTATRQEEDDRIPIPACARVDFVFSTRPGCGKSLVTQAIRQLKAEEGLQLYRSGHATPAGWGLLASRMRLRISPHAIYKHENYVNALERWQRAASEKPSLMTAPPQPPIQPYDPADAQVKGRDVLATVAGYLNLDVPAETPH